MEILKETENKDGTVTLECNFTEEEIRLLVNYAVVDILKKAVEEVENA